MNELTQPRPTVEHGATIGRTEPGWLIQALWLIFVGWWAGGIATGAAWFLNSTVIGLPLGLWILNRIPLILALQNPTELWGGPIVRELPQSPFLLRAAYFLLIGWWWSGIWLGIAYALSVTIILLPVALPMIRLAPFMTTLKRY